MTQTVDIRISFDYLIGKVTFIENPQLLQAQLIADGFKLHVPITISLKSVPQNAVIPFVSNFRSTIYATDRQGGTTEVGEMRLDDWEQAIIHEKPEYASEYERNKQMVWTGSLAQLATFEKIRDGRVPELGISFVGELCFLVPFGQSGMTVRTEPRHFNSSSNLRVSYRKEVWVEMLRRLGVGQNVLVETPLPANPATPWDGVWNALIDARNAFEQGGSTGWKGCVSGVRLALEKWREIETEDHGPGWVSPKPMERNARTKEQRLDNLRWDLMQLAHLGPHTPAEGWTRDDALLMLATLSALLAQRRP